MDNDDKDDNGASIVAPSETPPLVNDGEKIAPVSNREDNDKVGAVESTPTDEMMKAFALSQGAEGLSAPTEEELEELARKEEDRVAEKKAKAKAEKKRRRNERRRQRALALQKLRREEAKQKRLAAADAAKQGAPPNLSETNIWVFEMYDWCVDRWHQSETFVKLQQASVWYHCKRQNFRRRYERIRWKITKFYRRYMKVSPAERQRRQLNSDFKYCPKTSLEKEYKMPLDQLMYANIFDRERSAFVTVRSKVALRHLLRLECVLGVASEVAFLLKADTDFLVEFVFRDHTFDVTTTHAFRLTKRTMMPAVATVISDQRAFYHRCQLAKPKSRHLALHQKAWLELLALKKWLLQKLRNNKNDEDEVEESEEDRRRRIKLKKAKRRQKRREREDARLQLGDANALQGEEESAKGNDCEGEETIMDGASELESTLDGLDSLTTKSSNAEDGVEDKENNDNDSDASSVSSGAESEAEALMVAKLLQMAAVTDVHKLVSKWYAEGPPDDSDPFGTKARSWRTWLVKRWKDLKAKLRRKFGGSSPVAPEDSNDKGDMQCAIQKDDTAANGIGGAATAGKKEEKGEEEGGGEEDEKSTKHGAKRGGIPNVFWHVSTILSKRKTTLPEVLTPVEIAAKQLAEKRAAWFEDPTPTLWTRDPMRREGPNRHLSDLSDESAVPPRRKPPPTTGKPVAACESSFYTNENATLDAPD